MTNNVENSIAKLEQAKIKLERQLDETKKFNYDDLNEQREKINQIQNSIDEIDKTILRLKIKSGL